MYKSILLIMIIALIGIVPTGVFAGGQETLDASEFFYGNSIANSNDLDVRHLNKAAETGSQAIDLSNANFFYGEDTTAIPSIQPALEHRGNNVNVAAPTVNRLSPEVFYGYGPVWIEKKCSKC